MNEGAAFTVALASSWKNREQVRILAGLLRFAGISVYDLTDRSCRTTIEQPPEANPELFDPAQHHYPAYLDRPHWRAAMEENRRVYSTCKVVVLLLPSGCDSHADWGLAIGSGARSVVVGHPGAGQRSPDHLWTDAFCDNLEMVPAVVKALLEDRHAD